VIVEIVDQLGSTPEGRIGSVQLVLIEDVDRIGRGRRAGGERGVADQDRVGDPDRLLSAARIQNGVAIAIDDVDRRAGARSPQG